MKGFGLQGDISSGFRWCGKGAGEQELEEMMGGDSPESALIPVVDSTGTKRWARIQSGGKKRPPSGTAITFDLSYDLLLASEREARRRLLIPALIPPPDALKELGRPFTLKELRPEKLDPYVARELHLQELRDKELRDLLDALFGKNGDRCVGLRSKAGDWRIALYIESQHNGFARGELKRAMDGAAAQGDTCEVGRFLEAFKALDRLKEHDPVKVAKAWALLFTLECRVYGEPLPTKGKVIFLRNFHAECLRPAGSWLRTPSSLRRCAEGGPRRFPRSI